MLSALYAIARPSVCLSHGWIIQTDGGDWKRGSGHRGTVENAGVENAGV